MSHSRWLSRLSFRRWLDRLCFLGISGWIFAHELLRGLAIITVRLDLIVVSIIVVTLQAVVSAVTFTGVILLSGILFLAQILNNHDRDERTDFSDPRSITAIVPVYKDADILNVSVSSLVESTMPVSVCIVCEPDDQASVQRARTLAAATDADIECRINTRYPGSKAGAINFAIETTESDYVAVFDADEAVHPQFLRSAAATLEECDIVQGRTVPRANGIIETIAYYESILLSYTGRRLLYYFTEFRMAASRAVVMHRSSVEATGGYDPTMLTEDYAFAYQCYKQGLDVREMTQYPSTIEAAHTVGDWWGQRKRWMSGYAQVFHALLRESLPPQNRRDLLSLGICLSTVAGNILLLSLTSKFMVLFIVSAETVVLLPVITVVGITGLIRCVDYSNGTVERVGWGWLLTPIIFPLYGLVATKALTEYVISWTGEWYHVDKTP